MSYNFSSVKERFEKTLDHVSRDIGTLRTGRASTQMLDSVTVEAYGGRMRLIEVASVQAPDPSMLLISPWDKSLLMAVEKGIVSADLNLSPVVDGDIIRIAIQPLTEEKRKEMVKSLAKKIEAGKVMVRTVRTDAKKEIEELEGSNDVSEDDIESYLSQLDEITKSYVTKLESIEALKEKELMTV